MIFVARISLWNEVKLRRADAYVAQTYPLLGTAKIGGNGSKNPSEQTSSDFVNASLLQLQAAARSPFGTISEPTLMPLSL